MWLEKSDNLLSHGDWNMGDVLNQNHRNLTFRLALSRLSHMLVNGYLLREALALAPALLELFESWCMIET